MYMTRQCNIIMHNDYTVILYTSNDTNIVEIIIPVEYI